MRKIIFADLTKVNLEATIADVHVVHSAEQLTDENKIFLMDTEDVDMVINETNQVYLPVTILNEVNEKVQVYFDLEQYPFYQKIKETITDTKGVLRFRRVINRVETERLIVSDLILFYELLGEPRRVFSRRSNPELVPHHIIITVDFGDGTMAHLEYTFADAEKIELEWSGVKHIIEFDSDEMNPFHPKQGSYLPLSYSADSILHTARQVDENLLNRLEQFTKLLQGGAN